MIGLKLYFTFKRSTILALVLILISVVFVSSKFTSSTAYAKEGSTNYERINYLNSINCKVQEEIISQKEIVIPDEFSDVYERYNGLQLEAGFNLVPFKGAAATLYTYKVSEYKNIKNAYVNLIVCNSKIIGGDIFTTELNGQMLPLKKP